MMHTLALELYFWNMPQIQYMNPNVQIIRFVDETPNPFIRCWLSNQQDVIFDCDSQSKEQILDRIIKTLGKTKEQLKYESSINVQQVSEDNQAIFGYNRKRFCMCEVPGQCPCPGVIQLPKNLRGKYRKILTDNLAKYEREVVEEGKPIENFEIPDCVKRKFFLN
ncbi:hypothetical protein SSS_07755 [Sarcoptes scabiei]|nr:hypothetical protein SSS_07755 [Sarcoptes scabiei]